jgi:CheY-like chemotaxis protein
MNTEGLPRLHGVECLNSVAVGEKLDHKEPRTAIIEHDEDTGPETVKVLVVGGSTVGFSSLSERLEKSGYKCEFVTTCLDGARLVGRRSFDLVLCSGRMKGFQLLLSAARRTSASLFRYLLVEDGCWWVPTVLRGERCTRAPAFRDSEFANALETMVKEVRFVGPNAELGHSGGDD